MVWRSLLYPSPARLPLAWGVTQLPLPMPHDLPSPAMVASSKWLVRALLTLHAESPLAALPDLPGLEEALPIGSQSPGWLASCHSEVPAQLVEWLAAHALSASRDLHLLSLAVGVLLSLLTHKTELIVRGVYGAGKTQCIALLAAFFALRGHQVYYACRENTTIVAMATFVQELLPRAPEEAWPTAIRLLSHTQARTSESTNLDARDTDKNQQIWHAKLVLATTGLHLAQFRQPHRPLAKAVDYADLFIYDEAQQEAALSDLAILGALPRKCLVLRLGDPKQTSGGTGPSDLARRVRLVSDQLALGIRAPRKPCLPQAIPALIQSLLQDDLPQACCPAPQNVAMAEHARDADVDGAPPIGGKPSTDALMAENPDEADVDGAPPIGGKPSTDALLSAESARLPLALALLQVTGDVPLRWHTAGDLDACAGERAPHNWSIMLPVSQRVQPGVYTLMALSRYRDALVQRVGPERPLVNQPLVPHILTACYQVVLLPPRDFGEWPPVARDVYYAVALFLQVRAAHPDLIQKHRGAGSLLLTPRLDTQATFAKLFADIGVDGDIRYARVEELLRHGPPAPASITARHVQALRADLRAETLSHAAGLTSHTTLLVFGKSGFIGQDEAGHGRSTVGLTRARGTTIILGPPDPYGLTGLVQTTYAYCFTVHTADWQLPDAPFPLSLGSQDLFAALRPLEATSWAEVPLALQIENPEGRTVLLRLTLKRRKLPHPSFDPLSELPIYPRVTGPEANHCFWGYCGSCTNRTFGWYGTNQYGAFLRICNTTPKIRLRLPHTGNEEVLQDGYRLVLLPKLAYYAMWDGHGESFAVPRAI